MEDYPPEPEGDEYDDYEEDEEDDADEEASSPISFSVFVEGNRGKLLEADIIALRYISPGNRARQKHNDDSAAARVSVREWRANARWYRIEHDLTAETDKLVRCLEDSERNVSVTDTFEFTKPIGGLEGVEVKWTPDPNDHNTRMGLGILIESPAELAERINMVRESNSLDEYSDSMEYEWACRYISNKAEVVVAEFFDAMPARRVFKAFRFLVRRSYKVKPVKE